MKIKVDTKFDIGDNVYWLNIKNNYSVYGRKGYIHKCKILAIDFYEKNKYRYMTDLLKRVEEKDIYSKLNEAKKAAANLGYSVKGKNADIKYIN